MDSVYELICMLISLYNRGFPIILEEQLFCKKELGHIHISNILFLEIHLFDRNAVFSRIFEYWTKTGYIRVLQNRMEGTNQASSHHAKGQKKQVKNS